MRNTDAWSTVWWRDITGSQALVQAVIGGLLEAQHVFLCVPPDLPWRHSMRRLIEEGFRYESEGDYLLQMLDVAETCPHCPDIGLFLLEHYAPAAVRHAYRPNKKESIQGYLLRNGVLREQIFWVKGMPARDVDAWVHFCQDCPSGGDGGGLFVLELPEALHDAPRRNIRKLHHSDYISTSDLQLFNTLLVNHLFPKVSEPWRDYMATVATNLCQTDAEVSEAFLRQTDFQHQNPLDTLEALAHAPQFSKRGTLEAEHVLQLFRQGAQERLRRRLWMSQIQIAFPIIEMERVRWIERYEEDIQLALESYDVRQFQQVIQNPYDLELGILRFMLSRRNALTGDYILYLPDEDARDYLYFLHERRNELAHMGCTAPADLDTLFQTKKLL